MEALEKLLQMYGDDLAELVMELYEEISDDERIPEEVKAEYKDKAIKGVGGILLPGLPVDAILNFIKTMVGAAKLMFEELEENEK